MFAGDRWSNTVGYVVHPVATATTVRYVSAGVMFARAYTRPRLLWS